MDFTDYLSKKMDKTQNIDKYDFGQEDKEIDLKKIFNTLKRSKKFIFGFTLGASLIASYYFLKATPKWSGSFNIVVKDDSNRQKSMTGGFNTILNLSKKANDGDETQRLILKSPSVLMPVFDFVKNYKEEKGINTETMFFNNWVESALKIEFEAGSSVLKVEYFSKDKKLIIDALNLISAKYQSYSKKQTEKEITKSITYLEEQKKIMKKKSIIATKEFNEFSINNGLGNIDGFVGLGNSTSVSSSGSFSGINLLNAQSNNQSAISNNIKNISQNSDDNAGIRFENQYKLLQKYEANFIDLSAKLKPNSKILNDLSLKIDNLREALKRPNEILLKYKELKNGASRNEQLLSNIEGTLEVLKLNKIKTPDPWEMISEPTLVNKPIYPNRTIKFLIPIFTAIFLGFLISITKEKLSGKIFEKDDYEALLRFKYIDTLFENNFDLNENIIYSSLDLVSKEKIALIKLDDSFLRGEFLDEIKIVNNKDNFKLINIKNIKELTNYKNIILVALSGEVTKLNLNLIEKYLLPYKKKISGWFYIS